jgi:hypothetical protein
MIRDPELQQRQKDKHAFHQNGGVNFSETVNTSPWSQDANATNNCSPGGTINHTHYLLAALDKRKMESKGGGTSAEQLPESSTALKT